jgi:hypothetical protein
LQLLAQASQMPVNLSFPHYCFFFSFFFNVQLLAMHKTHSMELHRLLNQVEQKPLVVLVLVVLVLVVLVLVVLI